MGVREKGNADYERGYRMSTHRVEEFERYPKFKEAYIRAFDRMIKEQIEGGYKVFIGRLSSTQMEGNSVKTGQETDSDGERTFKWWIDRW